jgi:hypothetical protein
MGTARVHDHIHGQSRRRRTHGLGRRQPQPDAAAFTPASLPGGDRAGGASMGSRSHGRWWRATAPGTSKARARHGASLCSSTPPRAARAATAKPFFPAGTPWRTEKVPVGD